MKKIITVLLTICFYSPLASQNKAQAETYIRELLSRNNPDSHNMITALENMPTSYTIGNSRLSTSSDSDFMVWVGDYSKEGVLSSIGTVVHESCHGYQSQRVYGLLEERNLTFRTEAIVYYLSKDEEYFVVETETFPSRKLVSEINGDLRTFRFDTYVNTNSKYLGTQQDGVYGLMEEWSAYYNGFRTTLLNFEDYSVLGEMDGYKSFLGDAGSIRLSYYEFKFYILKYLEHARKKEPSIYRGVIGNEAFRTAFRAIDESFQKIFTDYNETLEVMKKKVEEQEMRFKRDDDYIFIGNSGVGAYGEEIRTLTNEINDSKYDKVKSDLAAR